MRHFLLVIFSIFTLTCYSQDKVELITKSDTIRLLQQIIREGKMISTSGVGVAGMPSKQWYSFAFLLSLVNKDQLFEMTKDTSACLRLHVYIGLLHLKYPNIDKVKSYLSTDTTRLSSIEGCLLGNTTVQTAITEINHWYVRREMSHFLTSIQTNHEYRKIVFDQIITRQYN